MGAGDGLQPEHIRPEKNEGAPVLDPSKFPVDNVNWFDSVEFCNKLSEWEGMKPYYDLTVTKRQGPSIEEAEVKILGGSGYHIPTDTEWEQGCRAGTKTNYHCGDKDEDLLDYAWFDPRMSEGRTHAVGEKMPNAFGLYDMHGNVREWNEEILTNATTGAPERVNRGGNWNNPVGTCTWLRYPLGPAGLPATVLVSAWPGCVVTETEGAPTAFSAADDRRKGSEETARSLGGDVTVARGSDEQDRHEVDADSAGRGGVAEGVLPGQI